MEAEILLAIHDFAHPVLDAFFLFSHQLGAAWFCATFVVATVIFHLVGGRRDEALMWALIGISTYLLQLGLKAFFARSRPALWVGPVVHASFAFPSGHALAAATFYPLWGWYAARRWPAARRWCWVAGVSMAFYVGFGRLYLGVHWPTDVLAGWTLGAFQTATAIAIVQKRRAGGLSSTVS
jgi:membrane-associated phospholipid phosphatase